MSNNNDDFWKQYNLLIKQLMDENSRFWTRFNVSLAVNAGILVAFIALLTNLDKLQSSGFAQSAFIGIIFLGLASGGIWIAIIQAGNGARTKLLEMGKKMEENRILPVKFFGEEFNAFLRGSITQRSYWYPIIYLGFWIGLAVTLCKIGAMSRP